MNIEEQLFDLKRKHDQLERNIAEAFRNLENEIANLRQEIKSSKVSVLIVGGSSSICICFNLKYSVKNPNNVFASLDVPVLAIYIILYKINYIKFYKKLIYFYICLYNYC